MAIVTTNNIKKKEVKPSETSPAFLRNEEKVNLYVEIGNDETPVLGCINGHNFIVPKGEEVEVAKPIAEIIKNCGYRCRISEIKKKTEKVDLADAKK